jgi:pimeloyl-ACP methyl ester carboxylesterase
VQGAWLVVAIGLCGCQEPASQGPQGAPPPHLAAATSATASTVPDVSAAPAVPAAVGGERFVSLEVTGFDPAVVAVPVGARDRRPIVIATHGNYDRPEWQCEVWAGILRHRTFVLCPRGVRRPDSPGPDDIRFTYTDNKALEKEVDAALAALRASTYAPYVAEGPVAWAGFSLGAIMGVAIAARRPADFSTLLLVEGGVERFGEEAARAFAKGGGRRVLFACAQRGCVKLAAERARRLEAHGLKTAAVDGGNAGHTYDGPVAEAVARALPALLADDPRFAEVFAP